MVYRLKAGIELFNAKVCLTIQLLGDWLPFSRQGSQGKDSLVKKVIFSTSSVFNFEMSFQSRIRDNSDTI
jgi:hypothetical protein